MTAKKFFFVLLGIAGLVTALTIGGIVFGSSMLKKKSADLTELKIQELLIEEQKRALTQAKQDIEKYQDLNEIAKAVVPQDKDQVKTIRQLILLADQSRVAIGGISFPQSSLGSKPPAAARSTDSDGESDGTSPKTPAPTISQLKAVDGIKGLYEMEVDINVSRDVTYLQLIGFLERLENNRRTAQITNIGIKPNQVNRNILNFDLSMKVFVKP